MQDELDEKNQDYRSVTHEEWCDLLSTMEFKDNRVRAEAQINKLAAYKEAPSNY